MAKRETMRRGSKRRGGYLGLGSIVNTAMVPASILAMQQSYKRKRNGGKRTRRHRRRH